MLVIGGLVAAGLCLGGLAEAFKGDRRRRRKAYRLSSRGRRAAHSVKAYNANMRFKTRRVAARHRLYPGDHSRIVPLDVSVDTFRLWFPFGVRVVDLRRLRNPG